MTGGAPATVPGRVDRGGVPIAFAITLWVLAAGVATVRLAGAVLGLPSSEGAFRGLALSQMASAGAIVIALCVAITLAARAARPQAAWPALMLTSALIVTVVAVITESLVALLITVAFSCLVWVGGELLLVLLPHSPTAAPVRVPLAAGLGAGVFGLLWMILAVTQRLDAASVLGTSGTTLAILILAARQTTGTWPTVSAELDRTPPGWYETVLLSLSGGIITFALLAAFVPENVSDATRQHLPIAREFWQAHGAVALASMPVSVQAIQNHVMFSVAFGFGGVTAANLFQAAFGLASIAGVAALGWLLAGRFGALVAACVFGTMPLVLWELGHAFIDLLPVLLTTSAVACLIIWQRYNSLPWLVLAGALAGVGVSTKFSMAALILGIAAAVFLVGRAPWNLRERVSTTLCFCLGALTIVPWLAHVALSTGTLPGLDAVISRMSRQMPLSQQTPPEAPQNADTSASAAPGPPADFVPFGHAPLDIVRLPWTLTFSSERFAFPIVGRGEIGVAALLLTPFSFFGSRQRTTAMLALIAVISYLAWWLTPYQISRHLLPTLAIVAALGGGGVAALVGVSNGTRWQAALSFATRSALLLSIAVTPIFFVAGTRTQMPIPFLTGAQSRESYIQDSITAATPLLASSDMLAPDTPVAFLGGMWDAPQIYTEARLVFFNGNDAGATPEAVLSTLEQQGVRYIIWNRGTSPTRDSSSTIRSTPFLRQYTRILAGDHDAYLFEVLPAGDTIWGLPAVTNLLDDPALQDVRGKKGPWATEGKSVIAQGVVALSRRATLTQEVAVTPGHAYLLEAPIRCLDASGRGILTFRWLDAGGDVIDTASEEVLPGREITSQFLWRRAPDGAARVQAEFSMAGPARCEFSGAALYDLG